MSDIETKRVHATKAAERTVYVGTSDGLLTVATAGTSIGTVSLATRRPVVDLACWQGDVVVAHPDNLTVGDDSIECPITPSAVGATDARMFVTSSNGECVAFDGTDWNEQASIPGTIHAMDGREVASTAGWFRIGGEGLETIFSEPVADVAAGPPAFAASQQGLFSEDATTPIHPASFCAVASTTVESALWPTIAATSESLYGRTEGDWIAVATPSISSPITMMALGSIGVATTEEGTLVLFDDETVRTGPLGFQPVTSVLIGPDRK